MIDENAEKTRKYSLIQAFFSIHVQPMSWQTATIFLELLSFVGNAATSNPTVLSCSPYPSSQSMNLALC
jgi:hypothetical protein